MLTEEIQVHANVKRTATLLQRDRQIEVLAVVEGVLAQHRIAVVPLPERHVGIKGPMPEAECVSQEVYLAMPAGAWNVLVDFLQKDNVTAQTGQDLDDALWAIPPIVAPEALMNVVDDQPQEDLWWP